MQAIQFVSLIGLSKFDFYFDFFDFLIKKLPSQNQTNEIKKMTLLFVDTKYAKKVFFRRKKLINITILNDDRCKNKECLTSHGFSLFLQKDNIKLLFDVGQDDLFIKNAKSLNIDLQNIDFVVLSHGHYDHSLGLKFFSNKVKLICHPESVIWRKSKRTDSYNGIPFSKEELEAKFDVIFTKEPYFISKDIIFLGQIERKNNFECKKFPSVLEDGSDDIALDDTGLGINTENGLIIISGCGHSGICNTIEQAKKITNNNKVYAVVGGFHLKEIDEQVEKTIEYFQKEKINRIYLGHCNSDLVCNYFKHRLNGFADVQIVGAGLSINF